MEPTIYDPHRPSPWHWCNAEWSGIVDGVRTVLGRGPIVGISAEMAAILNGFGADLMALSFAVEDRALSLIIAADCSVPADDGAFKFRVGDVVRGLPPAVRNHPDMRSGTAVEGINGPLLAQCAVGPFARRHDLSLEDIRQFVGEFAQMKQEDQAMRRAPDLPAAVVLAEAALIDDFGTVRAFRAGQRVKQPAAIAALLAAKVRLVEIEYDPPSAAA